MDSVASKLRRSRIVLELRHLFTGFHNLETVANRSRERYRRIAATIGAALLSKGVAAAVSLLTIPLTIGYLGTQRYGLWMTISSLIAVLGFADIGLGSSLLNAVAHGTGQGDGSLVRRQISSAFVLYMVICILLGAVSLGAYLAVPWPRVFNVTDPTAVREAAPGLAVFMLCYAVSLPAGVVQSVQSGLQEGFASNLWQTAGSIATLLLLVTATKMGLGLPWLILVLSGTPVVARIVNSVAYFGRFRRDLAPSIRLSDPAAMRRLLTVGAGFVVVQLYGIQGVTLDTFLISHYNGAATVSEYAVVARAFALITLCVSLVLTPFWPAYGEAFSRGDFGWLRLALRRTFLFGLGVASLGSVVVVLFGKPIISFWTHHLITPQLSLLVAFAAYTIATSMIAAHGYVLLSTGNLRFTVISSCLMLPVAVAAKYLALKSAGTTGLLVAGTACQMLFVTGPALLYVPAYLRRAERRSLQRREDLAAVAI